MIQESEIKTLDKYTQFTQPYPNRIEPDLELNQFPIFTDIELTNPTKDQLLLRREESKRLNIIFDNNNTSYEDKNIKDILSKDIKNSSRMDDIYDIDLPDCFMRSAVVKSHNNNEMKKGENIKEEKKEEKKEEIYIKKEINDNINKNFQLKNENKNEMANFGDFDIDIDFDNNNIINNNNEDKNDVKNEDKCEKEKNNEENEIIEDKNKEDIENQKYSIIDIDEGDDNNIEEEEEGINKQNENNENENSLNKINDKIKEEENKIKSDFYNKEIIDINEPLIEEEKIPIKEKEKETFKTKKQIKNLNSRYNMTTLNIIGEKNIENFIGQIIEKGHNYPSNLGIIKSMNLEEFSENYFGEKLEFQEIAMRDTDFEKIIKLIPIGNKKYLFNKENASKEEISKEENDIIILHGKAAQETFYYIMKLTGQINHNSVYTIFKLKNNKRTIRHFKESIGINDEGGIDSDYIMSYDGLNYGIVEDPNINYYGMSGHLFLSKYRRLLKKEKEAEEKKKLLEEKKIYNENFNTIFSQLKEKYSNIINNKTKIIEEKKKEIERKRNIINQMKQDKQNCIEIYENVENDRKRKKNIEEELKSKIFRYKREISLKKNCIESLDRDFLLDKNEYNRRTLDDELKIINNKEEIEKREKQLEEKEQKLKEIKSDIFCCSCHERNREVIFCECSHLMICIPCLHKISEEKGKKIKATCPACKRLCRKFFYVK